MALATRTLGKTGVDVTVLGYGAMELRGSPHGPDIADRDAGDLLNTVLDSGVTFIDTSIDYGHSEELIGRYISHRRGEYFLATKCGCPLGQFPPETPRPLLEHFTGGLTTAEVAALLAQGPDYVTDLEAAERLLLQLVATGAAIRIPAGHDAVWKTATAVDAGSRRHAAAAVA